ncbi:MAG: tetratricopeptide repeat protein [Melioribacteraceae bacterium]|nr:tetratricopeptide repeat protein [Melioribacteraceae bacterium]
MFFKIKKLGASLALLFLISGCGLYKDFTTYFNTYYNAKTIFERTEEEILKQKKDPFQFREEVQGGRSLFPSNQTQQFSNELRNSNQFSNQQFGSQSSSQFASGNLFSGNINQDLTKVIEKCSKILQYEKESSFFPDALFMTGKALYYQQEYSKAQRKFIELAGLNTNKYNLINKLWLAKTYLQLRDFDEGLKLIEEVKKEAIEKEEDKIFNEASITKISFLLFREQYIQAISECQIFIDNSTDDEMKALVANQMGLIYLKLNDDKNALQAFSSVLKYEPTFDVELQARLQYAKLLKKLKKVDESENELVNMSNQGKFKNNLDEIYNELSEIYFEKGKYERAIDMLNFVDSTFKQLPTSGIASLKLGKIYEKGIKDYDSAYKYFNKASSSLAPREMKLEAGAKVKNFERYFFLKKELDELNTQLKYLLNPKLFIQDSIDYAIAEKEYLDENKKLLESSQSQNLGNEDAQAREILRQQQMQQLQIQQQKLLLEKLKNKSNEPIPLKTLIALGKAKKPERPTADSSAITTALATNYFNQGSLFYSELEELDSALVYFNKVLNDYKDKPIIPQTLFAMATYYDTKNDTASANNYYKTIVEKHKKDKLYEPAALRLGLIKKEEKKKEDSSSDPAALPFLKAEELYYQKKYQEAIDSFKVIAKAFPKSRFGAKSLYYTGLIYEENLKNYDSAAVAYGMLSKNFALEPLAKNAIAKYDEYTKEKERIKREEEEKKKALELKKQQDEEKKKQSTEKPIAETPIKPEDNKTTVDSLNDDIKPRPKKSFLERLKADTDSLKKKFINENLTDTTNSKSNKKDSVKTKPPIPD